MHIKSEKPNRQTTDQRFPTTTAQESWCCSLPKAREACRLDTYLEQASEGRHLLGGLECWGFTAAAVNCCERKGVKRAAMGDTRQEQSSNTNVQVAVRCRPLNTR